MITFNFYIILNVLCLLYTYRDVAHDAAQTAGIVGYEDHTGECKEEHHVDK